MSDKPDGRSFWTTLPGLLTGVAALITALVTAFGVLVGMNNRPNTPNSPPPQDNAGDGGAAHGGTRVESVSLRVDPSNGSVPCPVQITFSGRISLSGGGGLVEYRWVRDDGGLAPLETLEFAGPGSQDVSTTWLRGGSPGDVVDGWMKLTVLQPASVESEAASFSLICA